MEINLKRTAIIFVVLICVFVGYCFLHLLFPPQPTYESIVNEVEKYENEFNIITKYFYESDYVYVDFYKDRYNDTGMRIIVTDTNGNDFDTLDDSNITDIIYRILYTYEYQSVTYMNDSIYFTKWVNKDFGLGAVYSESNIKNNNEYIKELRNLSIDNWYYFFEE